jgi:hypothetical protein
MVRGSLLCGMRRSGYNATMRILRALCAVGAIVAVTTGILSPVTAATQTKSGSVDVSGVVPGPPPATAPSIDVPSQGTIFTEKNIEVKGSCIDGLIVRIFRNAIFAGSALCQPDGSFSLFIDLSEGRNDLIARQYDSLEQSSPNSDMVTVYYNPPQSQPSLPGEGPSSPPSSTSGGQPASPSPQVAQFQLIIDYDYSFKGVSVNFPFHLPIHFSGGAGPYAIAVNWGDGNTTVVSRESTDQFFVDHTYDRAGAYIVKIRVSDKNGNTAYLQFVLIVNGQNNQGTGLFGTPFSFDWGLNILLPSLSFGALGFAGGFFFSHYWQRRHNRIKSKESGDKKFPADGK